MKCQMEKCKKKARFQFSISTGSVTLCCGLHLLKLVRATRRLIATRDVGVYLQRVGEFTSER